MGNENRQPQTLTAEEVARINALPIREFKVGSAVVRGRFDEESQCLYYLDANGNLEGKVARVNLSGKPQARPAARPEPATSGRGTAPEAKDNSGKPAVSSFTAKLRKLAGATDEEIYGTASRHKEPEPDEDDEEQDAAEEEAKLKKKKLAFAAIVLLLLGAVGIAVIPRLFRSPASVDTSQNASEAVSYVNTYIAEDNIAESITVMQTKAAMIPGDILTLQNVQPAIISIADYNIISQSGHPLYRWNDYAQYLPEKENQSGYQPVYSASFLDAGAFLSYLDVSYLYPQTVNPWTTDSAGVQYIKIPVSADIIKDRYFCYGAKLDVEITCQVGSSVENSEDNDSLSILYTTRERHSFGELVICDMLDKDGNSLYNAYSHLIAVPAWRQNSYLRDRILNDEAFADSLTPAYIMVKIMSSQYSELKGFNSGTTTYGVNLIGANDFTSTDKQDFSNGVTSLMSVLSSVQETISREEADNQ